MTKLEIAALIIGGIESIAFIYLGKAIRKASEQKAMELFGTTDPEKALAIMQKMEQVKKAQ